MKKGVSNFYEFHSFLDPGCPITPMGPFRDNIRYFLQECAEVEEYTVEGMPIWCTFLIHKSKGVLIPLYTIEENVKSSVRTFCDHCRCAGIESQFLIDPWFNKSKLCKIRLYPFNRRQEARDAARLHIGDTGLIDYVLKSTNNVIIGVYVVRRAVNRATRVLEYTIQELRNCDQPEQEKLPEPFQDYAVNPGADAYTDVLCLYNNLLLSFAESDELSLAVRIVSDSKQFLKEWPFRDDPDDSLLRFICCILPNSNGLEAVFSKGYPPGEVVEVPLHSTIGDLKIAVESAMRDTYCIIDNLMITDIAGMEQLEDYEVLFGIVQSGSELWVRGFGLDLDSELKNEGGSDNWTVNCRCGARDDDGERMVSCDICEIWQHTRCCGIEDSEVVPPLFVCEACCTSLAPPRAQNSFEFAHYGTAAALVPCASHFGMDLIY
ncbi:PHD finger protein MALE MEIOCYTE DEATH 1-like [Solanum stenotomum]|uniref:PHD finger protein MALE MEIOCYTE DEATH 1-like n=1 Tax=Solanum stenotomum TaxID=172797 RepID=UPI0020D06FAE|nr:PHD finger protein MALE MEIOCYTE DEATH 1-like [Solanum stenotomum]